MLQEYVMLEKVEDVKRFVSLCNGEPFAVELLSGDYVVDAKSIMGIFSLDLSGKILLRAACEGAEAEAFARKIQEFAAEEAMA